MTEVGHISPIFRLVNHDSARFHVMDLIGITVGYKGKIGN